MNTLMLSSKSYKESKEHDFGDCFISDNGNDVVVFDCGSNEQDRKSTRLNSGHIEESRMPSSA